MDNNFIGKTRLLSSAEPPVISLDYLLERLGDEWKEELQYTLREDRQYCALEDRKLDWWSPLPPDGPPHQPWNLEWKITEVKTDPVKKWLAGLPDFDGQFKDAPPRLTLACIIKRIGEGWKTALEGAKLPTDYVSDYVSGEMVRQSKDTHKTADVVAWLSSLKPASPVESSLSERPADTGNGQKLPLAEILKPSPLAEQVLAEISKPSPLAKLFEPSPLAKLFESEQLAAAQSQHTLESLQAEFRRRDQVQGSQPPAAVEPFPAELARWVKSGELGLKAELSVDYLLWLEHPTDKVARESLKREIDLAIELGDLPEPFLETTEDGYLPGVEYFTRIEHLEPYRAWREKCPASLLSERTKIHKWLGATLGIEIPPALSDLTSVAADQSTTVDQRVQAILEELDRKNVPRMDIPRGVKSKLAQELCKNNPRLFTISTFPKVWQAALDSGKLRTRDHDKYTKKGRRKNILPS